MSFFITKICINYNERESLAQRVGKWALSARVREIKRPKLTDSYSKYFGSIPACPLVPVELRRKWPTFHSVYTVCEVCGLVISTVPLVRTMKAISRFYFFILRQEIYEINKCLHVTLQCSSQWMYKWINHLFCV